MFKKTLFSVLMLSLFSGCNYDLAVTQRNSESLPRSGTTRDAGFRDGLEKTVEESPTEDTIETKACGDGICAPTENTKNCPQDCLPENSVQHSQGNERKGYVQIDGNHLLWSVLSSTDGENDQLFLYNLDRKEKKLLANKTVVAHLHANSVVIGGHKKDIDLYQISTGNTIKLPSNIEGWDAQPKVFGQYVALIQDNEAHCGLYGECSIHIYDTTKGKTIDIIKTRKYVDLDDFHSGWVIYSSDTENSGREQIFAYNIQTKKGMQVTHADRGFGLPKVYGNVLVWEEYDDEIEEDSNRTIQAYHLTTGKQWPITTQGTDASWPHIDQQRIVWLDCTNGGTACDLYACDLQKNGQDGGCLTYDKKTRLTVSGAQSPADIFGEVVVYLHGTGVFLPDSAPGGIPGKREIDQIHTLIFPK